MNLTTEAVILSTRELVVAEQEAAQKVSSNITAGFLSLIRSQLEQKRAIAKSSIDAKSSHLVTEKNAAGLLELQFVADFQRIKNRYDKLFTSLNKTLKSRIAELDRPVFQLVEKEFQSAMRKRLYNVGASLVVGNEGARGVSVLDRGRAKGLILKMLEAIKNYLTKTQILNRQISSILLPNRTQVPREVNLPFVITEVDGAFEGQHAYRLSLPVNEKAFAFFGSLSDGVNSLDLGQTVWVPPEEEERKRIVQAFFDRLEHSGLDQRVSEQVKELFEASDWQTLKGVVQ